MRLLKPWTRQPQYPAPSPGWEFAWSGANPNFSGGTWSRGSGLTDGVGVAGKRVGFTGNVVHSFSRTGGDTTARTAVTFCAVVRWVSGVGTTNGIAATTSANNGFILYIPSSGAVRLTKGGVVDLDSSFTLTSGVTYSIVVSHDQVSGAYYMLAMPYGGGQILQSSGTNTSSSTAGNGTYKVGGFRDADATRSFNGDIFLAGAAFRYLPFGRDLLANPWQIFTPTTIWLPTSSASSGTTYTITPSGGIVFAGSGNDLRSKVISPSGGVTFAGSGSMAFASGGTEYIITPTGGITFAGGGSQVQSKTIIPTGGFSFAGTGTQVDTKIILPTDGISFSGTGSMTSNTVIITSPIGERTKVGAGT